MKQKTLQACSATPRLSAKREILMEIRRQARKLEQSGRIHMTKTYSQHGDCSVFEHCANVAYVSCMLFHQMHLDADLEELIRGALLHDYFLYDWHNTKTCHPAHAVYHPTVALHNAKKDYKLTQKEEDIILHHMFPLTILPPKSREAWMVCLADKICALTEAFGKVWVRQ